MFGSKKNVEETKTNGVKATLPSGDNALNSLVRGTVTEGNVIAESDIRIDGVIKGTLRCSAKVIVGPSGVIEGEVTCQNAVIEGKMSGILRVTELLSIKETGDVSGDVSAGKLMIAAGGMFNVTCKMKPEKAAPAPVRQEAVAANGASKKQ